MKLLLFGKIIRRNLFMYCEDVSSVVGGLVDFASSCCCIVVVGDDDDEIRRVGAKIFTSEPIVKILAFKNPPFDSNKPLISRFLKMRVAAGSSSLLLILFEDDDDDE